MKLMHPFNSYGTPNADEEDADDDMTPLCGPCFAGNTIKGNRECSNMVSSILPADPHPNPTQRMGSKFNLSYPKRYLWCKNEYFLISGCQNKYSRKI